MESNFLKFSLALTDLEQLVYQFKSVYGKAAGLKPVFILLIFLLDHHEEGLGISELARLSHSDKGLVSRECKLLHEKGLVERYTSHPGGHPVFRLSEAGRQKARCIDHITASIVEKIREYVSDQEICSFYSILEKVTRGLEAIRQEEHEEWLRLIEEEHDQ